MNEEVLKKIKKNPIVLEGFPGFGLVGTIVTEFLIQHLSCEKLGNHYFEELPANIAIHEGKVIDPIGIFYNSRFNIVIIHSLVAGEGVDWKAADFVNKICKNVKAKELICIEGVGSGQESKGRTFFFTTEENKKEDLKKTNAVSLNEGIIMGVTSAVLVKNGEIPVTCIFAETESGMPDNTAAARIVGVLDKLIGLDIDPKPLLNNAKIFEDKLKSIMGQMQKATDEKDKKMLSYVG
jgi:uncharacterized protein